ncbi:MAG: TauD/TfdA family dioxygenase, partial [Cyanobacteria bacterium J06635_10]
MKLITKFHTQSLSETVGQQIINTNNNSILELDKESIINLYRSHGLLLFRGFEKDVETFTKFTNELSTNFMDYAGGVFNRRVINDNSTILSVNDFNDGIKLHGEMYYQKKIPLMLWFFCAHPASENGETIVCDGKLFYDELSDSLKELFSRKKLRYRGHLDKNAWIKQYKTDDLNVVEQICKSNDIQLKINEDESIDIYYICPAIYPSKNGKDMIFISSLLPAMVISPDVVSFDDGSNINDEIMSELNEIAERITEEINWQKGDILM